MFWIFGKCEKVGFYDWTFNTLKGVSLDLWHSDSCITRCIICVTSKANSNELFVLEAEIFPKKIDFDWKKISDYNFSGTAGYQIRVVVTGLERMMEINRQWRVAIALKTTGLFADKNAY